MHLRSLCLTFANLHAYTLSTPLLPFLYETRTLQAKSLFIKARRPSSCIYQNHRNFCATSRSRLPNDKPRSDHNIPFEGIPTHLHEPSPTPTPLPFLKPNRESTITASEQSTFDRIFADLAQSTAKEDPEDELINDDLEDEVEDGANLQTIFDAAIQQLSIREDRYAEAEERNRLKFAERPLARAFNVISDKDSIWGRSGEVGDDYEVLATAHRAHEKKVYGMLDNVETDIELWRVLETEVFSLVEVFKARREKEEREAAQAAKKPKNVVGRRKKKEKEEDTKEVPNILSTSDALAPNALLSILQANYGSYCLHAMRLLRTRFLTSPYTLYLLPTIKRLGPISYVLGASTHLFNEILFIKWSQYSDLHGIADLMVEMGAQGVEANEVTLRLLWVIGKTRDKGRAGEQGWAMKAWWGMGGPVEGWKRIKGVSRRARHEVFEQKLRMATERGEEVGMDEGAEEQERTTLDIGENVSVAGRRKAGEAPPIRKVRLLVVRPIGI